MLGLSFLLFGEHLERWFSGDEGLDWLRDRREFGLPCVFLLLVGDLVLPVPASALIAAAGLLWGFVIGWTIGAAGSVAAGLLGFGIGRLGGRFARRELTGDPDGRLARLLAERGGWLVALSRWIPLVAETVTVLAGASHMTLRRFAAALLCGSVPMAGAYAAAGALGQDAPARTLLICALVPPALYAILLVMRRFWRN